MSGMSVMLRGWRIHMSVLVSRARLCRGEESPGILFVLFVNELLKT